MKTLSSLSDYSMIVWKWVPWGDKAWRLVLQTRQIADAATV